MPCPDIERIVDLDAWPLAEEKAARRLAARAGERYRDRGVCLLEGFLRPRAVAAMAAEAEAALGEAFRCDDDHNPYLEPDDGAFAPDHPRRRRQATGLRVLGCDQLSPRGPLMTLYAWEPLTAFLDRVLLDGAGLYRFADPIGAVTVNLMGGGDRHGWHYDEAQFTVSTLLQAPEGGGRFEYAAGLRWEGGDDYDGLARVLDGGRQGVAVLPPSPGALLLFGGRRLLHRVTEVEGKRLRTTATLCYRDRPGMANSPGVRTLFYGRSEALPPPA